MGGNLPKTDRLRFLVSIQVMRLIDNSMPKWELASWLLSLTSESQ
jgi:hypothetical protein